MTLSEKLVNIQIELKAPKSKWNKFGSYNYRSCEDILEAVKPLLKKYKVCLSIADEVVNIGERYYVKATASFSDMEDNAAPIVASALAREDEDKKGMDGSQITGTSSSYARKYALNGLFLIDDTKDADTDEAHNEREARKAKAEAEADKKISEAEKKNIITLAEKYGKEVSNICQAYKINSLDDMTASIYAKAMKSFEAIARKAEAEKKEESK